MSESASATPQAGKKLSAFQFNLAAATHLEGITMGSVLGEIDLAKDVDGNLLPHVVKNLRTMLTVATRMTPEETVRRKCKKLLGFLKDYE